MDEQADMENDEPEMAICPRCDGCGETTPWNHATTHACPVCKGTGERPPGTQ